VNLTGIPWRLIGIAAIALSIAGGLWYVRHLQTSNAQLTADLSIANANLLAERENARKEHESAQRYAARLAISRGPRSPPPRIMCRVPASVPASAAASGADDATAANDAGVSADVDLGPRIDVPFRACEENLIKLEELQRWVNGR
jgi:hypothetical protein